MKPSLRSTLINTSVSALIECDYANELKTGETFTFDALEKEANQSTKVILATALKKVSFINLEKLSKYAPYQIKYLAHGAVNDLICIDTEGDHFAIPSGVLKALRLAEEGHPFPELPTEEEELEARGELTRALIKALAEAASKTEAKAA